MSAAPQLTSAQAQVLAQHAHARGTVSASSSIQFASTASVSKGLKSILVSQFSKLTTSIRNALQSSVKPALSESGAAHTLSQDHREALTPLFEKGILTTGDPASEDFLSRLSLVIDTAKDTPGWAEQCISNVLKGDLDFAKTIQTITPNRVASTGSAQLDGIILKLGKMGEASGTQPEGHTEIRQTLSHILHQLQARFGEGGPESQLSSLKFDAQTVKTILSLPSMPKGSSEILMGMAMLLQSKMDGTEAYLDSQLKEAGIGRTAKEIDSFFEKGISGEKQLTQMCDLVNKLAKSLSSAPPLALQTSLTQDVGLLGDIYRDTALAHTLGVSGVQDSQRSALSPLMGGKVDMSPPIQSKLQQSAQYDKLLEILQTQIKATPEKADTLVKDAKRLMDELDSLQKPVSKSLHPLRSIVRLALLDALATHDHSLESIQKCRNGDLHGEILSHLDTYGVTPETKALVGAIIRQECLQFKGVSTVKTWMDDHKLTGSQKKKWAAKEEMALKTGQLDSSKTAQHVHSWVESLQTGSSIIIDTLKGKMVSAGQYTTQVQEAFLAGFSVDVSVSTEKSRALMIAKEPLDNGKSAICVTLSKSHAKKLGLSTEFLEGLLSVSLSSSHSSEKGIQFRFHSEAAATQFISGLMIGHVDPILALADAHSISFEKGKKVGVGHEMSAGIDLASYLPKPESLESLGSGFTSLSVTTSSTHSKAWHTTTHKDRQVTEASTSNTFTLEASLGVKSGVSITTQTTQSVETHLDQVLGVSQTRTFSVVGTVDKAVELISSGALGRSTQKMIQSDPALAAAYKTALQTLKPGDQLEVKLGLSPEHCTQVTQLMDPGSSQYNPEKAKAMLSDTQLLRPVSIKVMSATATELHSESTSSDLGAIKRTQSVVKQDITFEYISDFGKGVSA